MPKNEAELTDLLQKYRERGRIIAGGTGIYEIVHRGLISDVEALIDISDLGLSYVRMDRDVLKIGTATTMSNLWSSSEIGSRPELLALLDALKAIQPAQVKNVATIGGSICTALPFFDLPVALLSLDCSVVIGPTGRKVRLDDFLQGFFSVGLHQGEFMREVELPLCKIQNQVKMSSAFQKFSITGDDWAIINCGAYVVLDHREKIANVTLIFGGGVGEKPVRARRTETALNNLDGTEEKRMGIVIGEKLTDELEPISDMRASAEYRMTVAKVLGKRALITAARRALSIEYQSSRTVDD